MVTCSVVLTHAAQPTKRAKTKIVATLGPASESEETIQGLIMAGANVFRINMAHGTMEAKEPLIRRIRQVSEQLNHVVAVLADLGGPKIRLTELPKDPLECETGAEFLFIRGEQSQPPNRLAVTYDRLVDELQVGNRVLLADGIVELEVTEKRPDEVAVKVIQGGIVRSRQGVNLPGVRLSVHSLTDLDREHARWACKLGVDFLGMSFVRNAQEIQDLRTELQQVRHPGPKPRIVAKIERGEALENLEEIIQTADAVMVARGDLGLDIDVARLAAEQKRIIAECNHYQKPVITATQMLDSMTHSVQPTRAEATDVANAILDGTDACMLSGETAIGKYPVKVVEMMNRIALSTEPLLSRRARGKPKTFVEGVEPITQVVVHQSADIAEDLDARLLVVASHSGATALAMAKQRSSVPVVGVSDSQAALRQMCLYSGVTPLAGVPTSDTGELLVAVDDWGRRCATLSNGDRLVLVASTHWTSRGHNMVVVHECGE